ncbi:HAMP domain-containing sensor histidine kinase [Paenibacillus sp. N3.4]|uniref:sensor histidine kinase n=1 Tax=Paenibacillus sp. N3.4 TaxID=2603222 RepID=UPI0011C7F1BF|nr:HAMP domain-containing sensor histidine kinase [Paenibacillus sp. N3.4]TXK86011.1 HAMP domain-containing protein [Paenibacillus sp. N3.4]
MIKTLYLRVVLVFSAVVVISVLLAFPIAMLLYTDRITTEVQTSLLKIGRQLVMMSDEFKPQDLNTFLEASTELNDSYSLTLYDTNGNHESFGVAKKGDYVHIDPLEVRKVLSGDIYKSVNVKYGIFENAVSVKIGIPLTVNATNYAIFLAPKFTEEARRQSQTAVASVLFIVLLIGSFLILIASRYIVSPVKRLTLATNRLARGNFNVNIKVKTKDEIGLLTESFNHMAGELKQLEQMRQDFVSNVSHEIQSPLTAIRGFSKALRQNDILEDDRLRYLEIIERESERLSRLSENLLKLASLESEHHPFHPTIFDLDEQIRRIVVFHEPQWSEKRIDMDLALPRVKISGDADQLSQVWMNIIGNAVKFTPQGGHIYVKLVPLTDRVEVRIQDNGIGIQEEDQGRIFDRFYKADQARLRETGGSGLGLAIARKIIDKHQGTIEVQSEWGKGTLFIVTLPVMTFMPKKS